MESLHDDYISQKTIPIYKKKTTLLLYTIFLFMGFFSTGYAIGVEVPTAKYAEQEYKNAVDILASQNVHRQHDRIKTAKLSYFLGWAGGENFYLHQYIRFGIFITIAIWAIWSIIATLISGEFGVVATLISGEFGAKKLFFPAIVGLYSIINGRAYSEMSDQQFDQIYNPEFFGQVAQVIGLKRDEDRQKQTISKLNKMIDDCRTIYTAGDYDEALTTCQSAKFKSEISSDKNLKSAIHELMGNIYEKLGDNLNARKEYAIAISNAQDVSAKARLEKDFKRTEETFVKTFLNEDYQKRKFIMPVDNAQVVEPSAEHINILDIKKIPNIEFRDGSPAINQLYIGHPYIDKEYIPFEDSQFEILRERVGEFFELMQALGATKVDVKSVVINKHEYIIESNIEAGGHVSANPAKVVSKLGMLPASASNYLLKILPNDEIKAGATYKKQENKSTTEVSLHELKINQVFHPTKKPFLPEGLIWYKHEPSWQQLYRQRLRGDLLQHTERISTKNNNLIQDSEISQIAGELGIILAGRDINVKKPIKQKMEIQEDVELVIDVKFAPLDSLR
ncbi:MAG: hypothetical protein GX445_08670 [Elusimicrobia bacterium]|nr:hypothetical protein [Elusimicrobiota bacterium]